MHIIDADIDILIEDTVFCVVLASTLREADLAEAVRVVIVKATTTAQALRP
jgi:hypothetical protein